MRLILHLDDLQPCPLLETWITHLFCVTLRDDDCVIHHWFRLVFFCLSIYLYSYKLCVHIISLHKTLNKKRGSSRLVVEIENHFCEVGNPSLTQFVQINGNLSSQANLLPDIKHIFYISFGFVTLPTETKTNHEKYNHDISSNNQIYGNLWNITTSRYTQLNIYRATQSAIQCKLQRTVALSVTMVIVVILYVLVTMITIGTVTVLLINLTCLTAYKAGHFQHELESSLGINW